MTIKYENFHHGTITNNPLGSGATSISSDGFVPLPGVVAPDFIWIVLDPLGTVGDPEIVKVTAHAVATDTVTAVRAQQTTLHGGTAREHALDTEWRQAWTAADGLLLDSKVSTTGDLMTGPLLLPTTQSLDARAAIHITYADNNYVNVGGDTMTGALTISGVHDLTVGGSVLVGGFITTDYVLLGVTTPAASNYAASKGYVDTNFVELDGDTMTGILTINPTSGNTCLRINSDTPLFELRSDSGATRWGWLTGDSSVTRLASEGHLVFNADGSDRCRLAGSLLLLGKTASDVDDPGIEITAGGSSNLGRITSTTNVAGNFNSNFRHNTGADDPGEYFAQYTHTVSNNLCGSITQGTGHTLAFNTTSDHRLKNVLGPVVDALDKVAALAPKHLAWKEGGEEFDGFIAHEVDAVAPYAVTGDFDAVLGPDDEFNPGGIAPQQLDNSKLVPLLVAAVQELAARVAELEAR